MPTDTMPALRLAPTARTAWQELIDADPDAVVSQSPEWMDALCLSGYEDASRSYTTRTGARAILPLVRRAGGARRIAPLASMPAAWGMGGLLCEGEVTAADLRDVISDLRTLPAVRVAVRPVPHQAAVWEEAVGRAVVTRVARRAHVLDLTGGASAVWDDRFTAPARQAVRRAQRSGVEVRSGTDPELLCDFRRLFELSVRRWAATQNEPVALARMRAHRRDAPAKFVHIAAALPDGIRVSVAYHDDRPVAGIVVLLGNNASYTRGAMDKELAAPLRANELLHWLAVEEACARGCRTYHLGETGTSVPLAHFKEKLGGVAVAHAEYRFERLPLTRSDTAVRSAVKRAIGFGDAY